MEPIYQEALRRAGFDMLSMFQKQHGLAQTGKLDPATQQALEPYLYGFYLHRVQYGDTFYKIAQRFGTTVKAILAANPGQHPNQLAIGTCLVVPLPFGVVPTTIPFTSQVLQIVIHGLLARYPFLKTQVIARTAGGRMVPVLQLGTGARRVFYNAAHHANEWITTPILMKFLEDYCAALVENGRLEGYSARELYQKVTLHLAPMVNPDGVDLVTGAASEAEIAEARKLAANYPQIPFPDGWKANLCGVDLNLQYPAGWETAREIKFAQGYRLPGPRDYVGSGPLTEPESAAMAGYTQAIAPMRILAYHTQGQVIYWQYRNDAPPGAQELGERLAIISGYTLENTPDESGNAGYRDWFLQRFRRPGYTIEAGLGENPLPISQFEEIYARNRGILVFTMAEE